VQRIAASSLILAFACGGSDPEPNATTDAATEPAETTDADDDSSTDAPTTASTTDEPTTAPDTSGSADTTTGEPSGVPELDGAFVVIATADDGLNVPRDLEFAPDHPDQLWVVNGATHGVVIITDPGTAEQAAEARVDAYGQHFMAYVSSLAFGVENRFASCQESRDEWNVGPQPPDDFMGPSLWSADLDIFAVVNQEFPPNPLEGSHLDMLHQSPLCMGIAHDTENVFWAHDGIEGHIVRYDFMEDHGPGGSSHADGIIRRYLNAVVTRVAETPSHMVLDHDTGMLYVADTSNGRVMRLDTASGASNGDLPNNWDGADEYTGWDGATFEPAAEGLDQPSGIALNGGRIFVSDAGTGELVAFEMDGTELGRVATSASRIMGIDFGPDGLLYYADGFGNEVVRIEP
jgi:glucose/arabinose dehydrogenase